MVRLKRTLLLTLVFMLSLSSAAFGMTGSASGIKSSKNLPTLELQKPDLKVPERLVSPEAPDEKVRIIVELEKAPAIETATNRGLLYKDLPSAQRDSLEFAVESDQVNVQASVKKVAPSIEYFENFTTVFNGFSAEVDAKFVETIAATNGVKAVYESTEYQRPEAKPEMIHSKELVQAQRAWNKYKTRGAGIVVGVIDTGIDSSHRDMILTDDATGSITKEKLEALKADGSIENGKYFTAKVPFGYNYMDGNEEILDIGPGASMHGMHVGGTVAANGNEENGGIKGVAPEAQILALKVFGNDPLFPSTFGDIYIKAIDDAIKLGVDVINMSLGSTAAYVKADDPEQQAVKRATENGVLVAISAGNSDMFGSGTFYPYAANQDYGLTGAPSVANESLGVASYENSEITAYGFSYQFNDEEKGQALYLLANDADPTKQEQTKFEIMDAGLGNPEDFIGKDFKGKFALVSRGVIGFVDKGLNAQEAGAAGVIIYNNAAGTINMASDPAIKIPYISALQADGKVLKAGLDNGEIVTVDFDGSFVETANANAGQMSSFTSWGPTPNLDFKPEITAPGGNIFSTFNNNEYGLMSGTSMAAPHVAGGTALIYERVDKEFGLTGSERYQLAKKMLMNTALPVELEDGEFVSPRRQGSGLMQLANALETDVIVTNKATGEAKVALKEIKDNQFTFTLEAKNFSDEEKNYNVDVAVQTDAVTKASGVLVTAPNLIGSFVVTDDVTIDTIEKVTIPAKGQVQFDVTVNVKDLNEELIESLENGFFVDGFVTLTDPNEEVSGNVPLVVPFFGFNGEWDAGSIFDNFAWNPMTYWGYTALADEQGEFIQGGGSDNQFDTTRFGFSPNGDGIRDKAIPVFSLLRNAKQFKVKILDNEGKELRTIRTASELRKHYIESATANPYTYNTNYGWDGKVNGEIAADGNYFIELSAVIDFEGAKWQSIKFPVKVDTVAPTAKVEFDEKTGAISVADFKDDENGTGADRWEVLLNGKVVANEPVSSNAFVLKNVVTNKDVVTVKVWDSANNFAEYKFSSKSEEETKEPVIFLNSPGMTATYDTNEVVVSGTVEDDSKIVSLTVNGEKAEKFDGVNFSHTLTVEDGVRDVKVEAEDEFGNKMQIRRIFFVDTQAPIVSVKNYPTKTRDSKVTVKVTVKDNFDDIGLYVNDNEVYRNELSEPYAMNGFEKDVDVEVSLVDGKNEFTFEAEDLAGHKTTQTITIEKTDVVVENPGNGGGSPPPVTPTPVDPKPEDPKPVDPKPVTPPVFTDITNIFAKNEINKLAAKGIIQGKTETKFAPNAQITRAEFTVLLARALDLPLKEYAGTFSDVNTSKKWAYAAVEAAAHAGIVNGTTDGKFNPDAPIKREEIAAMVIRAIEYQDKTKLANLDTPANFKDHGSIGAFAIDSVYKASALGVILGNNGQFNPKNNATRAEAAVMLYRALEKLELLD